MKTILLLTLLASPLLYGQGATGLNSERTKIDSNGKNGESVNYYCNSVVHAVTSKGVIAGTETTGLFLIVQVPSGLKSSLQPGMRISAWLRKAPKLGEYVTPQGNTLQIPLYGYLQPRDPQTKIAKRNQQRVY